MTSRLALLALIFTLVSCGSIPESQTQGGMNRQAAADAQRADTEMKAVYAKLSSSLQGQDLAELKASQKAFEAYRQAESLAAGGEARGGTMEPMLRSTAYATLTEERTRALRLRLVRP